MVAPIAKNTVHSTLAPPPSDPADNTRSPAATPPAEDVRRQAADDVYTLQARGTSPASRVNTAYQRAVDEAARTYLEGGGAPLRVLLTQNDPTLSALANVDADVLERDLEASFERQSTGVRSMVTGMDAGSVVSIVQSEANYAIRGGIVREAQIMVGARIQDLRAMEASLPQLVTTLRNAQPGSPEAAQASLLGIRGDAGDIGRARAAIHERIEGLETFRGRIRGQAWWQPSDFPAAAERAARRLNLEGAPNSPSASVFVRDTTNEQIHHAIELAEEVHLGLEVREVLLHAARGAAVAAGAAGAVVTLAMLVFAKAAYEAGEEARAEHIDIGRALGL